MGGVVVHAPPASPASRAHGAGQISDAVRGGRGRQAKKKRGVIVCSETLHALDSGNGWVIQHERAVNRRRHRGANDRVHAHAACKHNANAVVVSNEEVTPRVHRKFKRGPSKRRSEGAVRVPVAATKQRTRSGGKVGGRHRYHADAKTTPVAHVHLIAGRVPSHTHWVTEPREGGTAAVCKRRGSAARPSHGGKARRRTKEPDGARCRKTGDGERAPAGAQAYVVREDPKVKKRAQIRTVGRHVAQKVSVGNEEPTLRVVSASIWREKLATIGGGTVNRCVRERRARRSVSSRKRADGARDKVHLPHIDPGALHHRDAPGGHARSGHGEGVNVRHGGVGGGGRTQRAIDAISGSVANHGAHRPRVGGLGGETARVAACKALAGHGRCGDGGVDATAAPKARRTQRAPQRGATRGAAVARRSGAVAAARAVVKCDCGAVRSRGAHNGRNKPSAGAVIAKRARHARRKGGGAHWGEETEGARRGRPAARGAVRAPGAHHRGSGRAGGAKRRCAVRARGAHWAREPPHFVKAKFSKVEGGARTAVICGSAPKGRASKGELTGVEGAGGGGRKAVQTGGGVYNRARSPRCCKADANFTRSCGVTPKNVPCSVHGDTQGAVCSGEGGKRIIDARTRARCVYKRAHHGRFQIHRANPVILVVCYVHHRALRVGRCVKGTVELGRGAGALGKAGYAGAARKMLHTRVEARPA